MRLTDAELQVKADAKNMTLDEYKYRNPSWYLDPDIPVFQYNPRNIILNTDSYKQSHYLQYPGDAEEVWSYIESRGGKWKEHVFYGLQMFIKEYLLHPITQEMIDEADEFVTMHGLPFNREGWQYILDAHNGYLPIEIQAIPEGSVLRVHNALVQVHNTDPKVPWLTSFVETALLRAVWYPTTVATNSWQIKQIIKKYLDKTSEDTDAEIAFKLHDFGARGVSSKESAGIGGSAHLINFMGTDTLEGVYYARKYYSEEMAGFSIPASEHSTMTCWGGKDNEIDAIKNMIDQFSGDGNIFAIVSDSYDIYHTVAEKMGTTLNDVIKNTGGTLVVRPDSGDPTIVPVEIVELLMQKFGYTVNSKGYRVLPGYVRVIQGDGINIESIEQILINMEAKGLSASNIAFGMGGGMLQQMDRDTLEFAMKASSIKRNGVYYDVMKDPVTDTGKRSRAGRLAVGRLRDSNEWFTTRVGNLYDNQKDQLEVVFRNGVLLREQTFADIRERSNA